jgi:hypothetical protein
LKHLDYPPSAQPCKHIPWTGRQRARLNFPALEKQQLAAQDAALRAEQRGITIPHQDLMRV